MGSIPGSGLLLEKSAHTLMSFGRSANIRATFTSETITNYYSSQINESTHTHLKDY